jgi:hypothetical protein
MDRVRVLLRKAMLYYPKLTESLSARLLVPGAGYYLRAAFILVRF